MSETRTQTRARQYRKAKSGEGGTLIKWFRRRLLANPELNAKGRGLLQMKLLSSWQPFTMGVAKQAEQLNVSRWVVNALRRLAVETGLYAETEEGYLRVDEQWEERFKACKAIDLGVRLILVLMAAHAKSSDGWVHLSERQLAKQLGSKPKWISQCVCWLENLTDNDGKLFEVRREAGRKNAYRLMMEDAPEEEAPRKKATQRQSRQASAPTVDDIVNGLFGDSKYLAGAFRSDILVSAKRLRMTDSDAEVAAALGKLYWRVREARGGRTDPNLKGPLEILRYYVDWLGEQHWLTVKTVALLQFDGRVFGQWRREQARYEVRDCDPVTGRDRW